MRLRAPSFSLFRFWSVLDLVRFAVLAPPFGLRLSDIET